MLRGWKAKTQRKAGMERQAEKEKKCVGEEWHKDGLWRGREREIEKTRVMMMQGYIQEREEIQ